MTPEERVAKIMELRKLQSEGTELTDNQVRTAIRLIRSVRVTQAKAVSGKRAVQQEQAFSLDDF